MAATADGVCARPDVARLSRSDAPGYPRAARARRRFGGGGACAAFRRRLAYDLAPPQGPGACPAHREKKRWVTPALPVANRAIVGLRRQIQGPQKFLFQA